MVMGQCSCDRQYPKLEVKSQVALVLHDGGICPVDINCGGAILDLTGNLDFGPLERILFYFPLFIWLGMSAILDFLLAMVN